MNISMRKTDTIDIFSTIALHLVALTASIFFVISGAFAQSAGNVAYSDIFSGAGELITSNSTRNPARVAAGSSGQILTVGSNGYPAWSSSASLTGLTLPNNTYMTATNAAGSGTINVLKVDGTDETVLNADVGDTIRFTINDTNELILEDNQLTLAASNFQFVPGSSTISFRDAADTVNEFLFSAGGDYTVRGTMTSVSTGSLGWAVVDGTDNTACTSQCTNAAVFGLNLAAGATAPVMVGPADATADICLCAGAS